MKRLEAIFSVLENCKIFLDAGTDHGLIARYMTDKAERVIASDISEKCLRKARELLKDTANVEFVVSDGFKQIKDVPDLAAVCGMGGHTVTQIISEAPHRPAKIVVQPQTEVACVRRFLAENGYKITHDVIALENGRFYDIIKAERGFDSLSPMQTEYGKFYQIPNPILKARLTKLYQKYSAYRQTACNIKITEGLKEALIWQT